jgi:hypothetical protein
MTRKHDDDTEKEQPETNELYRTMRPDQELPAPPPTHAPPKPDNALPPLRVGIGDPPDIAYIEIPTQLPAGVRPYDFYHGGRRYEHHGEDADGTWLYRFNG